MVFTKKDKTLFSLWVPHLAFKNLFFMLGLLVFFSLFMFCSFSLAAQHDQNKLEQKIGQMIMVGFAGLDAEKPTPSMLNLAGDIRAGRVGGIILFEKNNAGVVRNVRDKTQITKLTNYFQAEAKKAGQPALLIAVDQEGGIVRRLKPKHGYMDLPSAREMGKNSPENTFLLAQKMGQELASSGFNVNFAPVLDLDSDSPAIGKYGRAFSADPKLVALHGKAFAKGLISKGLVPAFKHFPGHGSSSTDTHEGIADITKTWDKKELLPYQMNFESYLQAFNKREYLLGMVMVGHLMHALDPEVPASLSGKLINGLLRKQLGWSGVVVTDDLLMRAISSKYTMSETLKLTVNAGVDIILVGNNLNSDWSTGEITGASLNNALLNEVKKGNVSEARINESYQRIMQMKKHLSSAKSL